MTPRKKLITALSINTAVLSLIATLLVFNTDNSSPYWQIGYNNHLVLLSVKINSPDKYFALLALIGIINWSKVIIDNIAMPVLNFSIYNPEKKYIYDLSKNELQFFGNSIYLVTNLRRLLLTLISISQIDIAIWSIISSQISSAYVIYHLLNEKAFQTSANYISNDKQHEVIDVCMIDTPNK